MLGQNVQRVEEDVDAGAFVAGEDVGRRSDQLVVDRLGAEVQERAADVFAPGEVLQLLASAWSARKENTTASLRRLTVRSPS